MIKCNTRGLSKCNSLQSGEGNDMKSLQWHAKLKFTRTLWVVMLTMPMLLLMQHRCGAASQGERQKTIVGESEREVVRSLLRKLIVHHAYSYKGLQVFPLSIPVVTDHRRYLTLSEALARGYLRITELPRRVRVSEVLMENRCSNYVFIMAGEILEGAKQDRIVREDVLLPPYSGPIRVHVYCTERRRWHGRSLDFTKSRYFVPQRVRVAAKVHKSQTLVWNAVAEVQRELHVPSATEAAREVYTSNKLKPLMGRCWRVLRDVPHRYRNTVGIAVAHGRRILGIDVFANPELLQGLYRRLLESYVADVGYQEPHGRASIADVERVLKQARYATMTIGETDGVGELVEIHGVGVDGAALVYRDSVIHMDIFPTERIIVPQIHPGDRLPDLRYRREHRVR